MNLVKIILGDEVYDKMRGWIYRSNSTSDDELRSFMNKTVAVLYKKEGYKKTNLWKYFVDIGSSVGYMDGNNFHSLKEKYVDEIVEWVLIKSKWKRGSVERSKRGITELVAGYSSKHERLLSFKQWLAKPEMYITSGTSSRENIKVKVNGANYTIRSKWVNVIGFEFDELYRYIMKNLNSESVHRS